MGKRCECEAEPLTPLLKAEMAAWSLALPLLRRLVTVRRLAALMWAAPREPSVGSDDQVIRWASRLSRLRPQGQANCLERSLLLFRFLSRGGADPRLVLGVRHVDGTISGHAWIVVSDTPLLEPQSALADFEPVLEFGHRGAPIHPNDVQLPRMWN
jgi:hypothetical protein